MKAVTYQGIKNVQVTEVKDPKVKNADDIILKVTTSAICGSDLHLLHAMVPNMPTDYVIGHEPMGVVEEVGPAVTKVKKGDRVIIPFNVSCGHCWYCEHDLTSQCDNSNPHGEMGGFLGTRKQLVDTLEAKPNICGFHTEISRLLKSRMTVKWMMKN